MATKSDMENSVGGTRVHEPEIGLKTPQVTETTHGRTRRSFRGVQSSYNAGAENLSPISGADSTKSERNDLHKTAYNGDD